MCSFIIHRTPVSQEQSESGRADKTIFQPLSENLTYLNMKGKKSSLMALCCQTRYEWAKCMQVVKSSPHRERFAKRVLHIITVGKYLTRDE